MKENILKISIFVLGMASLILIVAVRQSFEWNQKYTLEPDIVYPTDRYGDLYLMSKINHFDQYLSSRFSDQGPVSVSTSLSEADILLFGDSFLFNLRDRSIPRWILDTTHLKISAHWNYSPIEVLQDSAYVPDKEKYLIYGIVERYIYKNFYNFDSKAISLAKNIEKDHIGQDNKIHAKKEWNFIEKSKALFRPFLSGLLNLDDKIGYEFLLKRGRGIHYISSLLATTRYNIYGDISIYTTVIENGENKEIFFTESAVNEPGGYFYQYDQAEINQIVNNAIEIKKILWENYKLKLILFPFPNKITLRGENLTGQAYNQFLPRLYEALRAEGIPVIEVYKDFKETEEILYYPTDTHWNGKGISIGMKKTLEMMDSLQIDWRKPIVP